MRLKLLFGIPLVLVIAAYSANVYSQQSPRWNGPNTATYPSGIYVPLPENSMVIPMTQPRVVVTSIGTFVINPSIRVHPSNNQQTEVPLVRHPNNPNIMLGGSNATNGSFISEGWYVTTDGGVTWFGSDTLNAGGNLAQQRGDPGPIVDVNNRLLMTHLTSNTVFGGVTGMGASYSTDFGATWSANVQISTFSGDDKNLASTNNVAPYAGHSYIAWTRISGVMANGYFSRTTDGGVTWSAPLQINTSPSGYFAQGHDLGKCGPQGQIYIAWTLGQQTSPYTERFVGFARSTNGGISFIVTEQAYPVFGTRSFSFNGWGIRTNGFPRIDCDRSGGPRNGWIYIVTDEANLAPAGSDADVILHRSTDGGLTWSAGIRVNQDPLNNGKVQFFPCISVDDFGGVNVVYYDNRLFPSVGDSCSVWMSRSIDGGTTWTDMEVSSHHFRPKPTPGLGGGYMGDYIGVTSGAGKVWPFWTSDFVSLRFQAWTTSVEIGPAINHTPLGNTSQTLGNRLVQAQIIPAGSGINPSQTKLLWSRNQTFMTDSVLMTNTTGNNWQANLAMTGSGVYRYYLRTVDSLGRVATSPPGAPANVHTFNSTVLAQFCKSTYVPIRDFTTSLDSFFVNATGTLTDINFRMDTLYHTFDGDVSFWIRSPQGTEVLLANQRGGGGQNYIMTLFNDSAATFIGNGTPPFTGSFRPENPLSALNGQSIYGWWRLRVYDASATDTGSVRRWCMFLETVNFTGIEETGSEVPTKFELSQNFPNPFNPATTIRYSVVKQVPVKLIVYDVLGREVSVLVNEVKNPGRYDVNFDASSLATGVYLYRLEAGDFVDVKKMVLVK